MELTNGPLGLPGIPQPVIFGYHITSHVDFLVLSFIFAGLVYFIIRRLTHSPFGNVLRGIREDDLFALSLGKNVYLYKVTIFSVAEGLAAIGGAGRLEGSIIGALVAFMIWRPKGILGEYNFRK